MGDRMPEAGTAAAERHKRRVALSSLVAALVLTALKLVVGLATNSLGILSEAAHSGLDLLAAAMTFWAVRAAIQPADSEHTYGHGKIENVSALFETLLLLLTCGWIVFEALRRIAFSGGHDVDANAAAFAVVFLSIAVDVSRSRALARAARRYHSQALEADALHFSTDVWSSAVVVLGLLAVRLADATGLRWLEKADAVAALGVAVIVVTISVRLGRRAVLELLDTVPHDLASRIIASAARVPGVLEVRQVRVRRSGPEWFSDVIVAVDRGAPVEDAHDIATRVEGEVRDILPGADVVVHVEPGEMTLPAVSSGRTPAPRTVRRR